MIKLDQVTVRYGVVEALSDVTLEVMPGTTLAILGANGAGKSSLHAAIAGLVPISGGRIYFDDEEVTNYPIAKRKTQDVGYMMEGRRIFKQLTVKENMEIAWRFGSQKRPIKQGLEAAYDRFPILKERMGSRAGVLSGGQQQMLALSCALIRFPKLLLLDEISLGLAPIIIKEIYTAIRTLAESKDISIVLSEQIAHLALGMSDKFIVLRHGRIVKSGKSADMIATGEASDLSKAYLGI